MTRPPVPEWAPHQAVWIGFPSHAELWEDDLAPAQDEVAAFAGAVHAGGKGEAVWLVAADEAAANAARRLAPFAKVIIEPFGDIWLRDTAAIVLGSGRQRRGVDFAFNGWGGKYDLPGDDTIGARLAAEAGLPCSSAPWILEGGAIDGDGSGTVVTTEQCLLNPNRNPALSQADIEARLKAGLGIKKLIWLGDGLLNDHTDGHIDNIARFIAPGVVACMEPSGADDPNSEALRAIIAELKTATDVHGRKLEVYTVPSPGLVADEEGEPIPASFMNFYIANTTVIVPVYGTRYDDAAVASLAGLFPGRRVVASRADHILTGGGSFHCITQQQPLV